MKVAALAFISALLIAIAAGINGVGVKANFFPPPPNTKMTIENPQNTRYNVTTITLNFTVETNSPNQFFYSLDYNELKPIENLTTVSEELLDWSIPPCKYYRKTLIGSYVFSNLSEGSHSLTVYQFYNPTENPKVGQDRAYSATANFFIAIPIPSEVPEFQSPPPTPTYGYPPAPFPTLPWIIAVLATVLLVGSGILFYFRKRKQS